LKHPRMSQRRLCPKGRLRSTFTARVLEPRVNYHHDMLLPQSATTGATTCMLPHGYRNKAMSVMLSAMLYISTVPPPLAEKECGRSADGWENSRRPGDTEEPEEARGSKEPSLALLVFPGPPGLPWSSWPSLHLLGFPGPPGLPWSSWPSLSLLAFWFSWPSLPILAFPGPPGLPWSSWPSLALLAFPCPPGRPWPA
jgi:hypothetical protein